MQLPGDVRRNAALRRLVLEGISSIEGVVDEPTSLVFGYRQERVVDPVGA